MTALKSDLEQRRRRAMLSQPHMKPLCDYLDSIRVQRGAGCDMPDFDPLDSGINARALFLFESPRSGSNETNFISRDNPDQVARHVRAFFSGAGIAREDTLLWNVVPWRVGSDTDKQDVEAALPYLRNLVSKLENLKVIVLFGERAGSVQGLLRLASKAQVKKTWMPSQRVFNRWRGKEAEVRATFREVAKLLAR